MPRQIVNQAIACGGRARGYAQGADTTTCAVYSSEWLADQATGADTVFTRADRIDRDIPGVVEYRPQLYVYTEANPVNGKIPVAVPDYKPTAVFHDEAAGKKVAWGNVGATITLKALGNLSARTAPRVASTVKAGEVIYSPMLDEPEFLLTALTVVGFKIVSIMRAAGHMTAMNTTDTEFRFFDPLVGEVVLPLANLAAWFETALVQEHFTKNVQSIVVTPVALT